MYFPWIIMILIYIVKSWNNIKAEINVKQCFKWKLFKIAGEFCKTNIWQIDCYQEMRKLNGIGGRPIVIG